jgi:hypothetical protein
LVLSSRLHSQLQLASSRGARQSASADLVPISGYWAIAREVRVDYAMMLGSVFLLLVGAGPVAADARREKSAARDA